MRKLFTEFIGPPGALGLALLRLVVGLAFMMHGWMKVQHPLTWMGADSWAPGILQALAAFSEFGGGLALILGLLTPIACFGIMCVMTTALFAVHLPMGQPFVAPPGAHGGSFELPLVYLAIVVALMTVGPGIYSLDALLFRKKPPLAPQPQQSNIKVSA